MEKRGPESKKENPFLQTAWGFPLGGKGKAGPFESYILSFEKLLLLVGSINVLLEKNKQLSTELLVFMEKVKWDSFQPPEWKDTKKMCTFEGNGIIYKWCAQEVSEAANRTGVSAHRFYFYHSRRN